MRKLLLLLLFLPNIILGQLTSSSNGVDIDLVYAGVVGNTSKPLSSVQVNDVIIMNLNITNLSSNTVTYIHVDIQYNNNAWTYEDNSFSAPASSTTSYSNWSGNNGMKWHVNPNYDANDLWAQWSAQGGYYEWATGWQVAHAEAISLAGISGTYATIKFKAKNAGANHNYAKNIELTMARVTDNSVSPAYTFPIGKVRGYDNMSISHTPLEDLDSNIYVKADFNSNFDVTKINVVVKKDGTAVSNALYFDSGGQINITPYVLTSTGSYTLTFSTSHTAAQWKAIMDNVITISDVTLTLKEVGKYGHDQFGTELFYGWQYSTVDTDNNRTINPQDAYNILGQVLGATTIIPGGASDIFANSFYPISKTNYDEWSIYKFKNNVTEPNHSLIHPITINFSNSSYTVYFKFAFLGDANMSHSSAVSGNKASSLTTKSLSYGESKKTDGFINGEWYTTIENNRVVATLKLNSTEVTALQLKVDYDDTILTFDEAVFNTGNTVTNFASSENGRINLGSIEQNGGEIETGEVFKIYFTGNVTSPVGLVSIFNTDAANINGNRLILNLQ
jgi:hypothetical protein